MVSTADLPPLSWNERDIMSFLKKLFSDTPSKAQKRYYAFHVKCRRCSEIIEGHIDLDNDLSLEDGGNSYRVRKMLMGSNRCFQQIEVEMTFTPARLLI